MNQVEIDFGEQLKEEGLENAISKGDRKVYLKIVQEKAVEIAMGKGDITADDVAKYFESQGMDTYKKLGNTSGAVFRAGVWEKTGKYIMSERPRRHRSLLTVWRYIG